MHFKGERFTYSVKQAMTDRDGKVFRGKRILLLQGPVGPFFYRLSKDLKKLGSQVYKVNFNGGDWLFYPCNVLNYRGNFNEWQGYVEDVIKRLDIDLLILFGDCRPMHRKAHEVASSLGVKVAVFEEGYIRPNHITLELDGVNGFSNIPRTPDFYLKQKKEGFVEQMEVGNTFWFVACWAVLYYLAACILKPMFLRYQHHRPLTLLESVSWSRSIWRKQLYKVREHGVLKHLTGNYSKKFFLIPLQTHNDSQIDIHSNYSSIDSFICQVVASFAKGASNKHVLVIKHHPLDRGYSDYSVLFRKLISQYGLQGRCFYIHDQHLPSLLDHALGVVVINSTVGLSALIHGTPVKVCGEAIYDVDKLTYKGSLESFWRNAKSGGVNKKLMYRYYRYLTTHTQINGSFYRRLADTNLVSGLSWLMK